MVVPGGKIRQHLIFKHRPHFVRRSGHKNKRLFAVRKAETVSCTEAIFENMRPVRNKRLLAVVIGHDSAARSKISL